MAKLAYLRELRTHAAPSFLRLQPPSFILHVSSSYAQAVKIEDRSMAESISTLSSSNRNSLDTLPVEIMYVYPHTISYECLTSFERNKLYHVPMPEVPY